MSILDELRAEHWQLRNEMAKLDVLLRPYYQRQRTLQIEIIKTFPNKTVEDYVRGPVLGVARYTRDGAAERLPLFAALDRLNTEFAPIRDERRTLSSMAKVRARMIKLIEERASKRRQFELPLHATV
jgi:hypothetical protein